MSLGEMANASYPESRCRIPGLSLVSGSALTAELPMLATLIAPTVNDFTACVVEMAALNK
jgi:hypothetical protein